jgi:hypothetical protein
LYFTNTLEIRIPFQIPSYCRLHLYKSEALAA